MFAETRLGDREVDERRWQFHCLFVAALIDKVDFRHRPVAIGIRIAVQVEALADREAAVRVIPEQRVGARFDCQLGLVMRHVIPNAVFRLTRRVQVEHRRPSGHQALHEAFDHVVGMSDRRLQEVGRAMCHRDQAHLLAGLFLALDRLAELRHVGNLAEEARGAGLAAGVGIHLRVDDEHLDRFA